MRELRGIIAEAERINRGAHILGRTERLGGRLARRYVDILIHLTEAVQAGSAEKQRQAILGDRRPSFEVLCIDERAGIDRKVITQSGTGRAIRCLSRHGASSSGLFQTRRDVMACASKSSKR